MRTHDGFELMIHDKCLGSVRLAEGFTDRLMGMSRPFRSTMLLLPNCRWVHTFFPWSSINIYFLDERYTLVSARLNAGVGRCFFEPSACHVLESRFLVPASLGDYFLIRGRGRETSLPGSRRQGR
jgi:hypothetical protein